MLYWVHRMTATFKTRGLFLETMKKAILLLLIIFCFPLVFAQQTITAQPAEAVSAQKTETISAQKTEIISTPAVATKQTTTEGDPDRPAIMGKTPNPAAATDAFLKIRDIKGESTEAKKPKEIVVVGSKNPETPTSSEVVIKGKKIKENVVQYKETDLNFVLRASQISTAKPIAPGVIQTKEDFEAHVGAAMAEDEAIEEVSFYYNKISMKYQQPAKLFGLFSVSYTVETEVGGEEIHPDEFGRVKVKFPWWARFTNNNPSTLQQEIEEELAGEDAQLANIDLQNQLQQQQRTFQTLSNVMKNKHDTAMSIIRKIG